jgi:hypothetical protein
MFSGKINSIRRFDMIKFRYCIPCEKMEIVFRSPKNEIHIKDWFGVCHGPFATIRPPELPANWIDTVSEPSAYELALMNMNGRILLNDLLDGQLSLE